MLKVRLCTRGVVFRIPAVTPLAQLYFHCFSGETTGAVQLAVPAEVFSKVARLF